MISRPRKLCHIKKKKKLKCARLYALKTNKLCTKKSKYELFTNFSFYPEIVLYKKNIILYLGSYYLRYFYAMFVMYKFIKKFYFFQSGVKVISNLNISISTSSSTVGQRFLNQGSMEIFQGFHKTYVLEKKKKIRHIHIPIIFNLLSSYVKQLFIDVFDL